MANQIRTIRTCVDVDVDIDLEDYEDEIIEYLESAGYTIIAPDQFGDTASIKFYDAEREILDILDRCVYPEIVVNNLKSKLEKYV